jgi:hypothetical protein
MMHGREKSDPAIVAGKPTNKVASAPVCPQKSRPQMIGRTNIVTQMPHELVPVATTIARLLDPTGRDNASARSFGDPHRLGALAASLLHIGRRGRQDGATSGQRCFLHR